MTILICGTQWHGNLEYFVGQALQRLGHRVVYFYYNAAADSLYEKIHQLRDAGLPKISPFLNQRYNQKINQRLLQAAAADQPDVTIIFNGLQIAGETLARLAKTTTLVNWLGDDPYRFQQVTENLRYFPYIFVSDPSHLPAMHYFTAGSAHYLPNATDETVFRPVAKNTVPQAYQSDIAFVGYSYAAEASGLLRGGLLAELGAYDVAIYGDLGWRTLAQRFPALRKMLRIGHTTAAQTNLIYNGCKIVLNIHHLQNRQSTSQRTFEASSAGAFQLAEDKTAIQEFFPHDEIVRFTDAKTLQQLVAQFIDNETERRHHAEAAKKITLAHHTYMHRVAELLAIIKA